MTGRLRLHAIHVLARQGEAVKFDPKTGAPVAKFNATTGATAAVRRYDPRTGQPIEEPAAAAAQFDPQTGKAAPKFDPKTGAPL